jgi:hypothetical protein
MKVEQHDGGRENGDGMRKLIQLSLTLSVLAGGLAINTQSSFGKPEYTKKEKKNCAYCHVAQGKKDLNDTGKCYGDAKHSLDGCAKR